MKNVYHASRPTWSRLDDSETKVILLASVLFAISGALAQLVISLVLHVFTQLAADSFVRHAIWIVVDASILTSGCLLMIGYFKKLNIGCYPSTFLYCFNLPESSNPNGKSQVLGYCNVKPNLEIGEIEVTGASFFWENGQLNTDSRVGFTSTQVHGTKEKEETSCHIRFEINKSDLSKRLYRYGYLQFRLDKTSGLRSDQGSDVYAGFLQSMHNEAGIQDVEVRSRGYAEWYSSGPFREFDIEAALRRRGDDLFTSFQTMLRGPTKPTIWDGAEDVPSRQTNFWGLQIPTPQSVVLNQELRPNIAKLLDGVLALAGMSQVAIERFKGLAISKAKLDEYDTRWAFERDLKQNISTLIRRSKLDAALYNRAETIKKQIEPFLVGESLLDIGCGNGKIAYLVKKHFAKIKLLDVVDYVPRDFGLEFDIYKEGEQLPVKHSFDTVLLLTVLHHSSNPVELLKLAWGTTRKRLIIIESVVGIHSLETDVRYDLVDLSDDLQIAYAAFVDWFYNRVLHDEVPVPYNFTTPGRWTSLFAEQNMKLARTIHLGQDIEIGPEYHILFVLQKDDL